MTVEAVVYTAEETTTYDDLRAAREATGTTWVRASDAAADEMERVADAFGIHRLAVEDVRNGVRPKTEEFDDHTFVLLKTATLRRGETTFREEIAKRSVGFFLGDDWLVTMSPEPVGALSFRKLLWPSREAVGYLARGDPEQVQETTEKYFRDVYDHLVQLVDLTETYRDLASGARDIYLNSLSLSTNEVMKRLTVVATIVLPLTFVVGVYGMNFGGGAYNMPELGWAYGYPAVMLGMLAVTVILVAYFRESGYV